MLSVEMLQSLPVGKQPGIICSAATVVQSPWKDARHVLGDELVFELVAHVDVHACDFVERRLDHHLVAHRSFDRDAIFRDTLPDVRRGLQEFV